MKLKVGRTYREYNGRKKVEITDADCDGVFNGRCGTYGEMYTPSGVSLSTRDNTAHLSKPVKKRYLKIHDLLVLYIEGDKLYTSEAVFTKKMILPVWKVASERCGYSFNSKVKPVEYLYHIPQFEKAHVSDLGFSVWTFHDEYMQVGCTDLCRRDLLKIIKFLAPWLGWELEG